MSILKSVWHVIAHDRRFLIAILILIEVYYLIALALVGDVTAIEPMTLAIKYLLPMAVGGYLLYREVTFTRKHKNNLK